MEKIVSYYRDWFESYKPEGSPIERVFWIFWAVWVVLLLVAVFRVIKFRLSLHREKKIWGDGSGPQKTAVVIVPIKGVTPRHTSDFFQSLLGQNYLKYRIIVAVEASDDPAAEWLFDQFGISLSNPVWAPQQSGNGLQNLQFVVAGNCKGRGQKVHNQLAAFECLTFEDEIIVFADADIICPADWLARLTAPINRRTHELATTYRWLVPAKTRLVNLFASVINASVTTQGGNVRENMPWGGSMAISRFAFDEVNVPVLFEGSINDDLRLGKAAKKAGHKVAYVRSLVRPTEIDFTWPKFFEFARRQYFQAKVFAPILYTCGNVIFIIYFLGFVSIVAAIAMGYLWAWVPLIIATLLDQIRAVTRESIYRKLFGEDPDLYRRIDKTSVIEHFLTPVYMSLHGLIIVSTWFMNKVEWGGIRYQVEGVNKTRVLKRIPSQSAVSHSSIGELALPAGGVFTALASIGGAEVTADRNRSRMGESDLHFSSEESMSSTVTTVDDTVPISVSEPGESLESAGSEASGETIHAEPDDSDTEEIREEVLQISRPVPAGACQFTVAEVLGAAAAAAAGIIAAPSPTVAPSNDGEADGSWEDFGKEIVSEEEETPAKSESEESGGIVEIPDQEEKPFTFQKLGEDTALDEGENASEDSGAESFPEKGESPVSLSGIEDTPPPTDETGGDAVSEKVASSTGGPDPASSIAVSAVPGVPSAVGIMGQGAFLPRKAQFRPPGRSNRSEKRPNGRIYLARREKMTRQQIERSKRRNDKEFARGMFFAH